MKLMSFFATWPQICDHSKTVTRRMRCGLKPGERFQAVRQRQGLPKGAKVERGPVLECVSNICTPLWGGMFPADLVAEGFSRSSIKEFVEMFCELNRGCTPETLVHRVEFKYVVEEGGK